jgi:hypothetical protein
MSVGVFAVHRGVFDHPIFAPEPYTEREAWIWMLSAAAWKDTRVRVGTTVYDLKRGELVFATRFLAERWKWNHSRVVRFLKKLKTETMVNTLATRDATHITICKYEEYQFGGNADETPTETQTETETKRQRNKEEEDNNLRTNNSRSADALPDKVVPMRRYAFEGRIVRLEQSDLNRWKQTYQAIPDIVAVLQTADDYYSENPPKDGKWFFPVSRWLQKEHDLWGEKMKAANARPDRSF